MCAIVAVPMPLILDETPHPGVSSRSISLRVVASAAVRPLALVAVAAGLILILLPAAVAAVAPLAIAAI